MKGFIVSIALLGLLVSGEFAGAQTKRAPSTAKSGSGAPKSARKTAAKTAAKKAPAKKAPVRRYRPAPPVDPTIGDNVDGDDLAVRRAAVAALGTMNGSVAVVDPSNGRVLTLVNQKLAFKSGFIPCSTIKLVT